MATEQNFTPTPNKVIVWGFTGKYLSSNFLVRLFIKRFFERTKQILCQIEKENILEVGCGAGFSTQYLRGFLRGKNFEASDLDTDLVKEAQKRNPGLKIEKESIYDLKRNDNSFDLLIALEVLEHLENPENALKELHRVSSKYCLLSVPHEPWWRLLNMFRLSYLKRFGNSPGHLQHWSKRQFIKFLEKYFQVKKVKKSLPWLIALVHK